MKKIYRSEFGSKKRLWYASVSFGTLEGIAMYTELWVIEWRERGDEILQTASTPKEAVETIQGMLKSETAFDESTGQDRPAFDLLFDGEDPAVVLQNLDESLEQECDNGELIVRRIVRFKKERPGPAVEITDAEGQKSPMTAEMIQDLKKDFLEWSGGFPPESEMQIFVYVEHARTIRDANGARQILLDWLEEENEPNPDDPDRCDAPTIRSPK